MNKNMENIELKKKMRKQNKCRSGILNNSWETVRQTNLQMLILYSYVMLLYFYRSVAAFELDSHPDYNKGPEPDSALVLRPIPFVDPNHTT